jgi:hypothetical protein
VEDHVHRAPRLGRRRSIIMRIGIRRLDKREGERLFHARRGYSGCD